MPSSNFFAQLGLLIVKDFLDAEMCARMRAEMSAGEAAKVVKEGMTKNIVDESMWRARVGKVTTNSMYLIHSRLSDLQPQLESHFDLPLNVFETPKFIIYSQGGFFTLHRDASDHAYDHKNMAEYNSKTRKVSVVIFLNSETDDARQDDYYAGGKLTFYGLMKDQPWKNCGLPLIGEEGLLIAFRSDVAHEVTPVTYGVRRTIVTWFH